MVSRDDEGRSPVTAQEIREYIRVQTAEGTICKIPGRGNATGAKTIKLRFVGDGPEGCATIRTKYGLRVYKRPEGDA